MNQTELEIKEAARWYTRRFGKKPVEKSVYVTWLCGFFHSYIREANGILQQMKESGLVTVVKGMVKPT